MNVRPRAIACLAASVLLLASCSSDDGGDAADDPTTTTVAADGMGPTDDPAGEDETLHIVVSNDDGFGADGIDVLVSALSALPDVEVTVVAPAEERSGTGGKTTLGDLEVTEVETASGHPATAVDGFPADSVIVAIEELELEPHLVVTGINSGQNVGSIVDISGTVGAARAAVARGIPALATSQGFGSAFDFESSVEHIVAWIEDRRAELVSGTAPVEVTSMNFPSCDSGAIRGLLEVDSDITNGEDVLIVQDCASTVPEAELADEVAAFVNGFATVAVLPDDPVEPYEVIDPAEADAPAA